MSMHLPFWLIGMLPLIILGACDGELEPDTANSPASPALSAAAEEKVPAENLPSLTGDDLAFICRGTVATTMGRDVDTISEYRRTSTVSYVEYRRPSDNTLWRTRCRIDGNRVVWSTVDPDGAGSPPGRWRDHPMDSVITFRFTDTELVVRERFSDGSGSVNRFTRIADQ